MPQLLTEEELNKLKNSNSKTWNSVIDEIKRKRNGAYPSDYWEKVMSAPWLADWKVKNNVSMDITIS